MSYEYITECCAISLQNIKADLQIILDSECQQIDNLALLMQTLYVKDKPVSQLLCDVRGVIQEILPLMKKQAFKWESIDKLNQIMEKMETVMQALDNRP